MTFLVGVAVVVAEARYSLPVSNCIAAFLIPSPLPPSLASRFKSVSKAKFCQIVSFAKFAVFV